MASSLVLCRPFTTLAEPLVPDQSEPFSVALSRHALETEGEHNHEHGAVEETAMRMEETKGMEGACSHEANALRPEATRMDCEGETAHNHSAPTTPVRKENRTLRHTNLEPASGYGSTSRSFAQGAIRGWTASRSTVYRRLSLKHGACSDDILQVLASLRAELEKKFANGSMAFTSARHSSMSIVTSSSRSRPTGKSRKMGTADIEYYYRLGVELGRGHFGTVRMCEELTSGKKFACKSITTGSFKKIEDVNELEAEVKMLLLLQGSFGAMNLTEMFVSADRTVHVVMDYCDGGDLFDYVCRRTKLSEREAARILYRVALSVHEMHERGVVHRDLKPENILLKTPELSRPGAPDDVDVRVADFGLAFIGRPDGGLGAAAALEGVGMAGSPFYMAPEIILGKKYTKQIDVWSLGAILYTCLAGVLPFFGKTNEEVFAKVCAGAPDFARNPWPVVSPEAKSLVQRMLTVDPVNRISTAEILAHPWITRHCDDIICAAKGSQAESGPQSSIAFGRIQMQSAKPFSSTLFARAPKRTSAAGSSPEKKLKPGEEVHSLPHKGPVLAGRARPSSVASAPVSISRQPQRHNLHVIPTPPASPGHHHIQQQSSPGWLRSIDFAMSLAQPFRKLATQ